MDQSLFGQVRKRAGNACEYCLMPQALYPVPFQIDHIVAQQHGGPSVAANLALACLHCNSPSAAEPQPKEG